MNISRLLDLAVDSNIPPESYFWEWNEYAEWQFRLLTTHMKVEPHHQLLDVGCGAMRLGHLAVPYLDDGHYCGVDAFPPFVKFGQRLMEELKVGKSFNLHLSGEFDFEVFNKHFDFAIAQSVLGHLSQKECRACLENLKKVMKPGGKLYATVGFGGRRKQRVGFFYGGIHPFRHTVVKDMVFWENLTSGLGIGFEVTDIPHPAQTVVIFTFQDQRSSSIGIGDAGGTVPNENYVEIFASAIGSGDNTVKAVYAATIKELAEYLRVPGDSVEGMVNNEIYEQKLPVKPSEQQIRRLFDSQSYLIDNALNNVRKLADVEKVALRVVAAKEAIARSSDGSVLDYGAGAGALTLLLCYLGAQHLGVAEVSEKLLEFIRWRVESRGYGQVETWNPLLDDARKHKFGAALVIDVFPVIAEPELTISRLAACLSDTGVVVANLAEIPVKSREKWSYLVGKHPDEIKTTFHQFGFEASTERQFGRHTLITFRRSP